MARRSYLAVVVIGILILAGIFVTISIDREPEARKSARIAYLDKQWNKAFNESARRLRQAPDDTAARLIQARSAARIGRDSLALEAYGRLPQRPEDAEDLFLVGSILVRMGRAADGESLLSRAVENDPGHPEAAGFLTDFLFRNRRFEAARTTARKRLDAAPADTAARLWLARVHDIVFEPRRVVELLGNLSNESPKAEGDINSPTVRKLLSRNHLRLHEPLEALKVLGDRAESDRESLWLTSRAYLQLRRKPEALKYLEMSKAASGGEIGDQEEPSPYVGAASCRECHEDIHDDQQSSRHSMTFRYGDAPGDLPWHGFEKRDFHSENLTASFDPSKQPLAFRFRDSGEEVRALVKFVMGSGRHAVTPVLEPADGTGDRESRWTWYAPVNEWDLTPGQSRVPAHPMDLMGVPQSPDMIRLCLGCHTTNPTEILARKGPTVTADRGIGCERCHGPGGNHVEASRLEFPDRAIGRFRRGSLGTRPQVMQACGECHGTIGRDLATGSDAAIVRFQSMTLSFSECFKQGQGMKNGFDCLTCYSPHRDVETDSRFYDSKCIDCHRGTGKADASPNASQARNCKTGSTNDCVRCHMPKIPSVQPHTRFTDHQIRVPKS